MMCIIIIILLYFSNAEKMKMIIIDIIDKER